MSSVIQNGPSHLQDSPAQEWICQNGKFGQNHRSPLLPAQCDSSNDSGTERSGAERSGKGKY